ncbi:MAG: nucleotide sugar epimerase [Dehalococcoidia bacterium]|nr:nucleotide sugar epimerase [Dehalococcoidia bacterium]
MTKHYLVTGAIGFIGTQVCKQLLSEGHRVTGIDSINDSYDPSIKHIRLRSLKEYDLLQFYNIDICTTEQLKPISSQPFDGVIHLAARAGVRQSILDPRAYLETNIIGTLNILELCKDNQINNLVFASTSSLYGETNSKKISETDSTDFPLTPYSVSKKAAEVLCYSYHYQFDINISITRFFTVYGPFGRPDMSIFKFIKLIYEGKPITIFGDGSQTRDFTHVEDAAQATIQSLDSKGYQILNIGSNNPVSVNYIVNTIEDVLGKKATIVYEPKNNADVSSTHAKISNAKHKLNWSPSISIQQGLLSTIQWYLENENLLQDIKV